jgi:small subunit ribosomal protein S16
MAVKLRLMRLGRRHRPFFRINAVDSRTPRDGKILEKLGHYDPIEKDPAKQLVLNRERVEFWINQGAIPSDTVSQILLRAGLKHKYAEEKTVRRTRARTLAHAKGKLFTKTERMAAEKTAKAAEEKAKAETEAKAAEEKAKAEAKAKAKAEAEAEAKTKAKAKAEAEAKAKAEAAEKLKEESKQVEEKAENKAQSEAVEQDSEAKAEEISEANDKVETDEK